MTLAFLDTTILSGDGGASGQLDKTGGFAAKPSFWMFTNFAKPPYLFGQSQSIDGEAVNVIEQVVATKGMYCIATGLHNVSRVLIGAADHLPRGFESNVESYDNGVVKINRCREIFHHLKANPVFPASEFKVGTP
jgi:hypothetical protein